jgi:hypothetical protein
VGTRFTRALNSYVKTTAACGVLSLMALLLGIVAAYALPSIVGSIVAVVSLLGALGAGMFACAGGIVIKRYQRGVRRDRDLFLELNRSREASAIKVARPTRVSRVRRWLARRLLGHDLVVGDLVEIKPWAEIRTTLDQRGCLDQLPFMPEMLPMCGRRAYVFRCVHRLFDYRKTRRMRHLHAAVLLVGAMCDGSAHGGCEAGCYTIWKSAWLRKVEPVEGGVEASESSNRLDSSQPAAISELGAQGPRYACQLTQLHAASQAIKKWSAIDALRPLVAGNVAPMAFIVGWLTHLFNELQQRRGGVGFPTFEMGMQLREKLEPTRFNVGDKVVVTLAADIRATLNDRLMHRGLWFEPDMLKHCGRRYSVQGEVKKLIDIVTGEMRTMKTSAYVLKDVRFSGERQLFNAQQEPLFWRSQWLQRDGESTQCSTSGQARSTPPGAVEAP